MKKYAGITIGPIFDTISNATSPAALWFASTFFSDLTRRICMKIETMFSENNLDIVSPYFDENDKSGLKEGVGKYHDRIFFSVEGVEESDLSSGLNDIIKNVKEEALENFGKSFFERVGLKEEDAKAFLSAYLQVHYIIVDDNQIGKDSCILVISPYLDALELMKSFPVSDQDNPFRRLMLGKEDDRNTFIKGSRLYRSVDEKRNPLSNGERIWNIQEISRGKRRADIPDDKYLNYFAVVSADGDGMGRFLNSLSADGDGMKKIRLFSERCLSYDQGAAKLINDYGGMAVYAGGDDLLFLAPVMNGEKTIFDICVEISKLFEETIKGTGKDFEGKPLPTVSFGVSAQYYKFPLYEALNRSRECLEKAKKHTVRELQKNCIYFHLEKHSGQSTDLLIGNEAADAYISLLKEMLEKRIRKEERIDERMVKSLGTKLYECRNVLRVMDRNYEEGVLCEPSWDNLFDNEEQVNGSEFRKYVEKWYYEQMIDQKSRIVTVSGYKEGAPEEQRLYSLFAALRIGRFFLEKKGDE